MGRSMKLDSPLLKAIRGVNDLGRPPVWLMRQAGRYMPSYQQLRKRYQLINMFSDPDLIAQITLLPLEELQVDAAIIFSDILLILDAMGLKVHYGEGIQLDCLTDLEDPRLEMPPQEAVARLAFLPQAIKEIVACIKVPLIGFTAAPFTLACYAIDGAGAMQAPQTHRLMWQQPEAFQKLLRRLSEYLYELAKVQVDAGVDLLHVFDSHTHLLNQEEFATHVMPSLYSFQQSIASLGVPVIYFARATRLFLPQLLQLPPCALGVDWQSDLGEIRQQTSRTLQGNFNPWKLLASPDRWREDFIELLRARSSDSAYICGLGHGILPHTPWENVRTLVDTVLQFQQ